MSAFVLPLRYAIGRIFTNDAAVVHLLGTLAYIFVAYIIADGLQTALTGVIKGAGKQYIAGPVVVFSYYGVAIPLSVLLALDMRGRGYNMGVKGLCIGTLVGTIVHMCCFAVVVYVYTDLEEEVVKLREKNKIKTAGTSVDSSASGVDSSEQGGATDEQSSNHTHNPIQTHITTTPNTTTTNTTEEDSWWDELDFLGIETTRPGRTAVSRNSVYTTLHNTLHSMYSSVRRGVFAITHSNSGSSQQYAFVSNSSTHGSGDSSTGGSSVRQYKASKSSRSGNTNPGSAGSKVYSSEYEMVRAYTDSLGAGDEDGVWDSDFDCI